MRKRTVTREGRGTARITLAIATLLALGGCAATSSPQGTYLPPPSGVHLLALEEQYDFGAVESGPPVRHVFRLKNIGPEVIEIQSVSGDCGCTAVLASNRFLAPGEEAAIDVTLDTYRLSGPQVKVVGVRSSDPVRPELTLKLRGTVQTPVRAQPDRLYLGRVPVGAVVSRHVDVQLPPDVQVTSVRSDSPRFTIQTSPLDGGTNGLRVRVTLLPNGQVGAFDDRIVITTSSPRQPELTIPVLGAIEGRPIYARSARSSATR
ncbi:MAG TPA: DUF1573 domain-containing protein [Candidatus Binatia bacterium]